MGKELLELKPTGHFLEALPFKEGLPEARPVSTEHKSGDKLHRDGYGPTNPTSVLR